MFTMFTVTGAKSHKATPATGGREVQDKTIRKSQSPGGMAGQL